MKISREKAVELIKKLDEGMNYGYIVQDALYSESKPDSDDLTIMNMMKTV